MLVKGKINSFSIFYDTVSKTGKNLKNNIQKERLQN